MKNEVTAQVIPGLVRNGKNDKIVWEVEDRFGRAKALRIMDHEGQPTRFAMVHGYDDKTNTWSAIRPVSDRYTPIPTGYVVDQAMDSLNGDVDQASAMVVRRDRGNTMLEATIRTNDKIEIGKGRPFDLGHPWSRDLNHVHGQKASRDVVIPSFRVRNAYDATSAIVFEIGLYRLICENGAKIMMAGLSIKTIHTVHEIRSVVEQIRKSGALKLDHAFLKRMPEVIVPADTRKAILENVPAKWHKPFNEYTELGRHSAWAVLNGLSYLQTHEYSLSRGRQLDKPLGLIFDAARN